MKIKRWIYILLIGFALFFPEMSAAQTEPLIYQFVVRDSEGDRVENEELEAELLLLEGSPQNGQVVYRETHQVSTSEEGIVRLRIGQGASNRDFSELTWNISRSYFVRVHIENLQDEDYTFRHTSELMMLKPGIFSGNIEEFADGSVDTATQKVKALSIRDNKLYLANGGVVELPEFFSNANTLLIRAETEDVSCYGMEDGAIDISVNGGFPPFSFKWSNGKTTQDLDSLKAGTYKVYVTDSKGYTAIKQVTVDQPKPLNLNASVSDVKPIGADNGRINLRVTGGRPPYTYQWSNGATTKAISGLKPGKYSVTVSSSNQCSKTKQFVVREPIKLSFEKKHVQCYGEKNGAVKLHIRGGKAPYRIRWSNNQTSQELTSLSAGKYYVSVKDQWGYQKVDSVSILQPYPLKIRDSVSHIRGEEDYGEIHLKVKGGIPPYQYHWSNGDTSGNLTKAKSGSYEVMVEDDNGCRERKQNIFVYRIMKDPRDSQRYKVITIGEQTWMAENLNIGNSLSPDDISTDNGIIEKYCYDDSKQNCGSLGGLYTWEEAVQYNRPVNQTEEQIQGVCPDGWHIPSAKEWKKLSETLGGEMVAGNKLKDPRYWEQPTVQNNNQIRLNITGFGALPAGRMDLTGESYYKGVSTSWWSASRPNSDKAWHRTITTRGDGLYRDASYTSQRYSVRCIKDD